MVCSEDSFVKERGWTIIAAKISCADWCNSLPRKILGYKTPDELFDFELDKIYAS
jgi:hypothetical protein